MIAENNPALQSWIEVSSQSDFPIQNLPFGIFQPKAADYGRVGVRIGDHVIDLSMLVELGYFDALNLEDPTVFHAGALNDFIALGRPVWRAVRASVSKLLQHDQPLLRDNEEDKKQVIYPISEVVMHLPVIVNDYTDFYSSIEHATNVGTMFRDPNNALLPNWRHLPVGYHGRASSIIVSGTPFHRPKGQIKPDENPPIFSATQRLDFELEMAFVVGKDTQLGESVSTQTAEEHIFGMVLFNDWSARDIQKWEYVPLGPFLGKSFASTISPWIVTLDALEPFRTSPPVQEPAVLDYLKTTGNTNFDIQLTVAIQPEGQAETIVCESNFKYMYWSIHQQLAHQTVNGCPVTIGDLYASGTISGKEASSYGSMLELAWKGTKPLTLKDGTTRKFIQDHDTIIMRGWAEKEGVRIGFGECTGKVLPTK
ncbi:MAG: fumarylacetoacetase [Thermonemataceae bacterium]